MHTASSGEQRVCVEAGIETCQPALVRIAPWTGGVSPISRPVACVVRIHIGDGVVHRGGNLGVEL